MHEVSASRRAIRSALAMLGALLSCGALLLLTAAPAWAHDNALTGSSPAASATLTTPPDRVTLNFRWRVRPGSTTVTVLGPDGVSQWQRDHPGELGNTVGVDLRALVQAGRYQVHYRGLSLRGFPFQGMMDFVLAPRVSTARDNNGGLPLPWIAGTAVLTACACAVGVRLGRAGL